MKYLLIVLLVLGICTVASADPVVVSKIGLPSVQGGMLYSAERSAVEACTTATLLAYPTKIGKFELRAGYSVSDTGIGALCYKVGDLTQFGFEQPLIGLLDLSIGGYAGYDFRDNGGFDYGVIVTVIEAKF